MQFEQITEKAFREVTALLATAYERYQRVQRVRAEPIQSPVNKELANGCETRPHVNGS